MNPLLQAAIDDLRDVLSGVHSRLGRTMLLVVSVALSAGALITSLGVGQTAAAQISSELAATIQDEVTISATPSALDDAGVAQPIFPADAETRARSVSMVQAAGLRLDVDTSLAPTRRFPTDDPVRGVQVVGATSGYLEAVGAGTQPAAWAFTPESEQRVALVGVRAGERLGIATAQQYSGFNIVIGNDEFQVVGALASGSRLLDDVVVIPYSLASQRMGGDQAARMVVTAEQGAGAGVADVIRVAIRPDEPTALTTTRVTDLSELRRGVESQLGRLLGAIGALLLVISGLLIASSMAASVVARTAEIGLRRALGASRGTVLRLFLLEGGMIGVLGGVGGASVGSWAVVVTSALNGWSAVVSPGALALGALLGLVIGVLASGYPAVRAARISPASAVRVE